MRLGIASSDWSHSIKADSGLPAMGGSGWIRIGQYLPYFETRPVAVGKLGFYSDSKRLIVQDWYDKNHTDLDIILIQRFMNIGVAKNITETKRHHDIVVVQDVDDWYWGLSPDNLAFSKTHPKLSPDNNISNFKKAIQASDYVITSTEYLADRLSSFFPQDRIRVVHNHVDLHRFQRRQHHDNRPVIGWFGSTAHRSGDLETMRGILSQVADEFDFIHIGHKDDDPEFTPFAIRTGLPYEKVQRVGFLRPDDLYTKGFEYDIGIVPLSLVPFNHAKSWIKGLEYTGAGVPFVAAPSDSYLRFKKDFGVGRIAKRPKDWIKHLRQLKDPEIRQQEADNNFMRVQGLDTSIGAQKLEATLKSFL